MKSSRFDPSQFPSSIPTELLRLAGLLDLAIYTSDAFDFCAPPMGGWHLIGPAGLSDQQLELQTSWRRTIPEAMEVVAVTLAGILKSHGG